MFTDINFNWLYVHSVSHVLSCSFWCGNSLFLLFYLFASYYSLLLLFDFLLFWFSVKVLWGSGWFWLGSGWFRQVPVGSGGFCVLHTPVFTWEVTIMINTIPWHASLCHVHQSQTALICHVWPQKIFQPFNPRDFPNVYRNWQQRLLAQIALLSQSRFQCSKWK